MAKSHVWSIEWIRTKILLSALVSIRQKWGCGWSLVRPRKVTFHWLQKDSVSVAGRWKQCFTNTAEWGLSAVDIEEWCRQEVDETHVPQKKQTSSYWVGLTRNRTELVMVVSMSSMVVELWSEWDLSRLTLLHNIAWMTSGTVPLDQQVGVTVPFHKKNTSILDAWTILVLLNEEEWLCSERTERLTLCRWKSPVTLWRKQILVSCVHCMIMFFWSLTTVPDHRWR